MTSAVASLVSALKHGVISATEIPSTRRTHTVVFSVADSAATTVANRVDSAMAVVFSAVATGLVITILAGSVSAVKEGVVTVFKRSAAVATIFLVIVCSYTEISATVCAFCMTSALAHEVSARQFTVIAALTSEVAAGELYV